LNFLILLHPAPVIPIPVEPSLEVFETFAKLGNVIPVYTQLASDFETLYRLI